MTDKPRSQDSTSVEGEPEDAGGLGTATLVSYFIATPLPPPPPQLRPKLLISISEIPETEEPLTPSPCPSVPPTVPSAPPSHPSLASIPETHPSHRIPTPP